MPIRFRCPHCTRLLGIARRKAGTQTTCPQCSGILTVPLEDDKLDLDEIDALLNPTVSGPLLAAIYGSELPAPDSVPAPPPAPAPFSEPAPAPVPAPIASSSSPQLPAEEIESLDSITTNPSPIPPVPRPPALPSSRPSTPRPTPNHPPAGKRPVPRQRTSAGVRTRPSSSDEPLIEADVDELLGLTGAARKRELEFDDTRKAKPVTGLDAMSLSRDDDKIVLSRRKATLIGVIAISLIGAAFALGLLIGSHL